MRKILPDKKYILTTLVILAVVLVPFGASAETNLYCFGWTTGINIPGCVGVIGNLLLFLVSRILWLTAKLFEITLALTLENSTFSNLSAVNLGWTIVRDVVNLFFIFILLYIAIGAILRLAGHDAKKLLVNLILAALLINFSLVITKVFIDASNILALEFYAKIGKGTSQGVTTTLMNGLRLSSIYSGEILKPETIVEETEVKKTETETEVTVTVPKKTKASDPEKATILNVILGALGGSALILVTAFVFFAATLLFITRTIVLWFLMILSPLAFGAMILPQTKKHADRWWQELTCQCLLAPAFMFMIYLVVTIIKSDSFSPILSGIGINASVSLVEAFKNYTKEGVGVILNFTLLIGLMVGSLIVSKNLACAGGAQALAAAGWARGKAQNFAKRYTKIGAGWIAEREMKKQKDIEDKGGKRGGIMGFARRHVTGLGRGLAAISAGKEGELTAKRKQYEKQYKGYSDAGLQTMLEGPTITSEKRKVIEKIQEERRVKREVGIKEKETEARERAEYQEIPGKLKEINNQLNKIMEEKSQDINAYLDNLEAQMENLRGDTSVDASTKRTEFIRDRGKINRLMKNKEQLEARKEKLEEKQRSAAEKKKLEERLGKIEEKPAEEKPKIIK